jgi:hypothetical protein
MATKAPPNQVEQNITSSTQSDVFVPGGGGFLARVRGTFVADCALQMSRDEGTNWDTVIVFAAADVLHVASLPGEQYRWNVTYTSGTAAVFLGR